MIEYYQTSIRVVLYNPSQTSVNNPIRRLKQQILINETDGRMARVKRHCYQTEELQWLKNNIGWKHLQMEWYQESLLVAEPLSSTRQKCGQMSSTSGTFDISNEHRMKATWKLASGPLLGQGIWSEYEGHENRDSSGKMRKTLMNGHANSSLEFNQRPNHQWQWKDMHEIKEEVSLS